MTAVWLHEVETPLLGRIAAAAEVFLFLDYDGTLAHIAPTPADAVPLPGMVELLHRMVATPRVQLAVVSGRPIAAVRRVLDVPGAYYVGVHGLEVQLPAGELVPPEGTAVVRSVLPGIKRRLSAAVGDSPGILLEDKGAALACHYRLASGADATRAAGAVADLVREYQRRGVPIELVCGHAVAEIRPSTVNKGKAVGALLATYGRAALAVCIGDDRTDEDAFRLLPTDAITIRVGTADEPTLARYRVATPDDVLRFLHAVLARRSGDADRAGTVSHLP
jgi:trehalose 6-phosphate phosphatase